VINILTACLQIIITAEEILNLLFIICSCQNFLLVE